MKNMIWVVDTKNIFKDKKYIVHVEKQDTLAPQENNESMNQYMETVLKEVVKRQTKNNNLINKKLTNFDRNSTTLINTIYTTQMLLKDKINDYECKVNKVVSKHRKYRRLRKNCKKERIMELMDQISETKFLIEQ